jgi:hypothetical protein
MRPDGLRRWVPAVLPNTTILPVSVILTALLLATLSIGCAGTIKVVSADFGKLPERAPLVRQYAVQRCVYWTDEDGQLCIAMTYKNPFPLGNWGRKSVLMSLVLDAPPTGPARSYRANRTTLRMIASEGMAHRRWASRSGIVTVSRGWDGSLRGKFRFFAKEQSFWIFTGWRGRTHSLVVGEFLAVEDATSGERILTASEVDGMGRTGGRQAVAKRATTSGATSSSPTPPGSTAD